MAQSPRGLAHAGVTVPDIEAAVDWYEKVLGFSSITSIDTFRAEDGHAGELLQDVFGDFTSLKIAHLATGNDVAVEFLEFEETAGTTPVEPHHAGWAHLCVIDRDVEGLASRIVEHGGTQDSDVWTIIPGEPYRLTYCRDPFDNRIEIYSHSDQRIFGPGA